jgi:AAA domain/Primase C terminal 2 (PriCT-2)/Bifunctional DNA primase/polymerase, N-terminal
MLEPASDTRKCVRAENEHNRPAAVIEFRKRCIENGYKPIPVRSQSKQPVGKQWQHGAPEEQLLAINPKALNTGVLTAGLRCFDGDVEDPQVAAALKKKILAWCPGALIRTRANSSRFAVLVRAAEGEPVKRSVSGPHGQLEALGAGQQVVAHGVHSSGALIEWEGGRGPDTVPRDQLPALAENQVEQLLTECAALLGLNNSTTSPAAISNVFEQPLVTGQSTLIGLTAPLVNELGAGIDIPEWFDGLFPGEKGTLVGACLNQIDNRTNDPRDRWLLAVLAAADAGRRGCPDAEQIARDWSRRGAKWTGDADFETAWNSAKPGAVTIGTLLWMAKQAGLDLSAWRDLSLGRIQGTSAAGSALGTTLTALQQQQQRAMHVSALALVPEKREWLHGTDAMRCAVTLVVAAGARGKSIWLIVLALACASGRPLLGAKVFGGPLRVLVLSAEDPTSEVARRVRAAMHHHGLKDADVAGLYIIGADTWGLPLLRCSGNVPAPHEAGWEALNAEIDRINPDIIILDPLLSLMGGVDGNNNSAAAIFMGKLVKLAADRRVAIVVAHHAAKGRDPTSAESAMGAASFVNFARIALTIEPLSEKDASRIGVPPWNVDLSSEYSASNRTLVRPRRVTDGFDT